tara:strand:- start:6745 stop:7995 length:1251 start_codon:yes stop_codon:yes gene_type:complete
MAIHPSNLGRISVAKQSAWGTKQTSFPAASFAEVEVTMPQLQREALMTEAFRGQFHSHRIKAGSREGTTVSLRMPMHGWSASTPTADPSASDQNVESILLEYAMGAVHFPDIMARTVSSATTSQITVSDTMLNPDVGSAFMAQSNSGGTEHVIGFIKSMTGADNKELNLATATSSAAYATGAVYGSMTHYISSSQPAQGLSLEYLGADSTSRIILFDGCVSSLKITASPRQQPMLEAELHFADFEFMESGGNPGMYDFPLPQLPAAVGNNGTRMVLGGSVIDSISAEFTVTCEYAAIGNHSSSEGVSKYIITNRTTQASVQIPASAITDAAIYAPGTALSQVQLDLNAHVPGSAVSILIPRALIESQSTLGDSEGIVAVTHNMIAAYYDDDASDGSVSSGSGSTTAADTVARVALL